MNRVFVEWYDESRPNWGGYIVLPGYSDARKDFDAMVAECGPPTKVEFRAAGEGYSEVSPEGVEQILKVLETPGE